MPDIDNIAPQEPGGRDPWDRRPGESDRAWEAFVVYRDMGFNDTRGRSLRRAAQQLGKNTTTIGQWSSKHDWRRRVEAYDREQDAIRRAAQADQLEQIVKRQGTTLAAAAQALLVPIQAYLTKLNNERQRVGDGELWADYDLRELAREARDAARLIPNLIQAERLVHGLSTADALADPGGGGPAMEDARRRAASMSRSEIELTLLGARDE